jgi:hypothetical protein
MISIVGFGRPKFGGAAKTAAKPAAKAAVSKSQKCPTCGK